MIGGRGFTRFTPLTPGSEVLRTRRGARKPWGRKPVQLNSETDYLARYHCASALIAIAGSALAGLAPVMLSGGNALHAPDNLDRMRDILEGMVGKRP